MRKINQPVARCALALAFCVTGETFANVLGCQLGFNLKINVYMISK
jgi:hypothetical protein